MDERDNGTHGEGMGATLMRALANAQRYEAPDVGGEIVGCIVVACVRMPDGTYPVVADASPHLPIYTRIGVLDATATELRGVILHRQQRESGE